MQNHTASRFLSAEPAKISDADGNKTASALRQCRQTLVGVALMSGAINLLYLSGSFFMLQVYDRVIPSRSIPTLVTLAIIVFALFAVQGVLDFIRSRILVRIGAVIDQALSIRVFRAVAHLSNRTATIEALEPIRYLDQIRSFFSNGGPIAFFDLPWLPLYVVICFFFHPWIGYCALGGAVLLVAVTVMTAMMTQAPAAAASRHSRRRNAMAEASRRNAGALRALGMTTRFAQRWNGANNDHLSETNRAADVTLGFSALSRVLRTAIQSLTLAVGAYLVIEQSATGGVMIASSILVARALAPVELAVTQWKSFAAARDAWKRLKFVLSQIPDRPRMDLPAPKAKIVIEGVTIAAPGAQQPIVRHVSFELQAGQALAIIGRSASGKSTLARALVGIWPAAAGVVRLDGAALDQWSPEQLGRHIGYMPQEVELFAGTVAQNISRFDDNVDGAAVLAAAEAADANDMILHLANGYDTEVGEMGSHLSAGQRQRIGLARALYGDPFLVVLDEPNSNLDQDGDAALARAIIGVRNRGGIVIVVAHRPGALESCDSVLIMQGGMASPVKPKHAVFNEPEPRPLLQPNRRISA